MTATLNLSSLTAVKIKFTPDLDDIVLDEDNFISDSAVHVPTQQSTKAYIDAIGGGLSDPIAYDAATNTPDLTIAPSGISSGGFYYVTVAGVFFTENVEPNDQLIAKQDNPTTLAHWIVSERNLDQATETTAGFAKLATQALTNAGEDDMTMITPKKLKVATSKVIFSSYKLATTSGPSTSAQTSGAAPTLAEMTHTWTPASSDNEIELFFSGVFGESATGKDKTVHVGVFKDGTLFAETQRSTVVKDTADDKKIHSLSTQWKGTLPAASVTLDIRFWIEGNQSPTAEGIGIRRSMIIKEVDE
jgi:hypothetical protein